MQSLIPSYDKKFTLRTLCASLEMLPTKRLAKELTDLADADDKDSMRDVRQFTRGNKELTLCDLYSSSPIGKEGILLLVLLKETNIPFYTDANKEFDLTHYDQAEAYDFLNAATFIL
jgi:hypothetical protein